MSVQEEQLFGAPPGDLTSVSVTVLRYDDGTWGVCLYGKALMREHGATLNITCPNASMVHFAIGAVTPLLQRSSTISYDGVRRHFWAIHNRLGAQGYVVDIHRCGGEPKR